MGIIQKLLHPKVDIGDTTGYGDLVRSSVSMFTPDIARLEKYQHQKVFLCDEFMSDRRMHHAIRDEVLECVVGFTQNKFNYLLSREGHALPVAQRDGYRIKGEIMVVRPSAFLKLDKLKLNGVMYERRRVTILDPYRYERQIDNRLFTEDGIELPACLAGKKRWLSPEHIFHQSAWMYFPRQDRWEYEMRRRPELFNRVPTFEPKVEKKWLEAYFKYQHPEDLD